MTTSGNKVTTVMDIFPRLKAAAGEVGIEIEMEGKLLPIRVPGWSCKADGSLRGESMEYVMKAPCKRVDTGKQLAVLWNVFKAEGSKLLPSKRCGVHVHLNVQDHTFEQVINFAVLFMVVEDVILQYCGDDRVGNMFTLSSKHCEYLPYMLSKAVAEESLMVLQTDDVRYSALNMSSLSKHGSMEFRAMRTTSDPDDIETWANILLRIKDKAKEYGCAKEIINDFSAKGPKEFLTNLLGPYLKYYARIPGKADMLLEGIRRVQIVAYTKVDEVKKKERLWLDEEREKQRLYGDIPVRHACNPMPGSGQLEINVYHSNVMPIDPRERGKGNWIFYGLVAYEHGGDRVGWMPRPLIKKEDYLLQEIPQPWLEDRGDQPDVEEDDFFEEEEEFPEVDEDEGEPGLPDVEAVGRDFKPIIFNEAVNNLGNQNADWLQRVLMEQPMELPQGWVLKDRPKKVRD